MTVTHVALEVAEHGGGRGTAEGVRRMRVTLSVSATPSSYGLADVSRDDDASEHTIASAQALCCGEDIRLNPPVLDRERFACPPEPRDHLVAAAHTTSPTRDKNHTEGPSDRAYCARVVDSLTHIRRTPCRSQMRRISWKYSSGGAEPASEVPQTGSAIKALTVSAPSARMIRSSSNGSRPRER